MARISSLVGILSKQGVFCRERGLVLSREGAGLLFFFTLVTGPRRSLSLELSDARVYEPQIRARLGTTAHFCEVVVLTRASPGEFIMARISSRVGIFPSPPSSLDILRGLRFSEFLPLSAFSPLHPPHSTFCAGLRFRVEGIGLRV